MKSCIGLVMAALVAVLSFASGGLGRNAAYHIEIAKSARKLQVFSGASLVRSYRISLGTNPKPAKRRVNDNATPEGTYYVCRKNPHSEFFRSLQISYPGPLDADRGLRTGVITRSEYNQIVAAALNKECPGGDTKLGGEIFIHGGGTGEDWTWGCIALSDHDMRELYDLVLVGTPVIIKH